MHRIMSTTHISLLLLSGWTEHTVPAPTVMMWVSPLIMAGRSGDWNSQPHRVTSVSPPAGSVLGKNCSRRGNRTEEQSASQQVQSWHTAFELDTWMSQQHLAADWPLWWREHKCPSSTASRTPALSCTFPNTSHISWRKEPSNTWSMS